VGPAREPHERASDGLGGGWAGGHVGERRDASAAYVVGSYGNADVFAHESRIIGPAAGGSPVAANAFDKAVCEPGDVRPVVAAATGG
jgi:hypothetical protein